MSEEKSKQIAELNDRFRQRFGMPGAEPGSAVPGQIVSTRGVAALAPDVQVQIWNGVIGFSEFDADDIYGHHDFGMFRLDSFSEKIIWKFDYYADARCEAGSEDPSDVTRCFRVLTVMLTWEY